MTFAQIERAKSEWHTKGWLTLDERAEADGVPVHAVAVEGRRTDEGAAYEQRVIGLTKRKSAIFVYRPAK